MQCNITTPAQRDNESTQGQITLTVISKMSLRAKLAFAASIATTVGIISYVHIVHKLERDVSTYNFILRVNYTYNYIILISFVHNFVRTNVTTNFKMSNIIFDINGVTSRF